MAKRYTRLGELQDSLVPPPPPILELELPREELDNLPQTKCDQQPITTPVFWIPFQANSRGQERNHLSPACGPDAKSIGSYTSRRQWHLMPAWSRGWCSLEAVVKAQPCGKDKTGDNNFISSILLKVPHLRQKQALQQFIQNISRILKQSRLTLRGGDQL